MPLPMKSLLLSLLLTPALIFSQAILAAEVNLNVFLGANPLKDVDVELDGKVIGITDATGGLSAELVAGEDPAEQHAGFLRAERLAGQLDGGRHGGDPVEAVEHGEQAQPVGRGQAHQRGQHGAVQHALAGVGGLGGGGAGDRGDA